MSNDTIVLNGIEYVPKSTLPWVYFKDLTIGDKFKIFGSNKITYRKVAPMYFADWIDHPENTQWNQREYPLNSIVIEMEDSFWVSRFVVFVSDYTKVEKV